MPQRCSDGVCDCEQGQLTRRGGIRDCPTYRVRIRVGDREQHLESRQHPSGASRLRSYDGVYRDVTGRTEVPRKQVAECNEHLSFQLVSRVERHRVRSLEQPKPCLDGSVRHLDKCLGKRVEESSTEVGTTDRLKFGRRHEELHRPLTVTKDRQRLCTLRMNVPTF